MTARSASCFPTFLSNASILCAKFTLRGYINNPYKYHNFNPPNSTYNKTDPSNFGTFTGTRGSFSDIGTGR